MVHLSQRPQTMFHSPWAISFGLKLSKDSQKRIMALIGEVNEFHKTRRRGLRRRKRNHYYLQTHKKIDEGKDSKIDSKHILLFDFDF